MENKIELPDVMSEIERAKITSKRFQEARIMNGFKDTAALVAKIGESAAKILMRAEYEDRRLPTSAIINFAATTYRVSTDFLYGRISCPESEDDQLMRLGMIHAIEKQGDVLIRYLGQQLGEAASDYLESIQPLGTGLLLKQTEELLHLTRTIDFTQPVRFKLNQIQISVSEIREARNDRSERIRARIAKTKAPKDKAN